MKERSTAKRARASDSNSPNARATRQGALLGRPISRPRTQIPLWACAMSGSGETATRITRRHFAINFNEGVARSRRSFRAPDQALESKDEGIHLWRTQWDLHRRSPEDSQTFQGRYALRGRNGRAGQERSFRGYQATGPRGYRRGSHSLRAVLRQPALAGRIADQLPDRAEVHQAAQGAGLDGRRKRLGGPRQ